MADELEPTPAPAPAAEERHEPPVVEGVEARVARLEERMDDTEAIAGAALMMHLEDDVDEEPERTEVEERHEPAKEERKEEPKAETPGEPSERHAGLFL